MTNSLVFDQRALQIDLLKDKLPNHILILTIHQTQFQVQIYNYFLGIKIYMPLSFKEQKPYHKNNRKPLTTSTNYKDTFPRKSQKSHKKNNIIKSSQQKLINRSSLNIKTYTPHEEETSHKKRSKDLLNQEIRKLKPTYQARETFTKLHQSSFNKTDYDTTQNKEGSELSSGRDGTQSPSSRFKQPWGKLKQAVGKQVYFYDKYSKKDINISIIQEKSLLSNNQENSLDSLNNFIIEGNNEDANKSLLQKSHQSSSFEEDERDDDWTLIEKQYEELIGDSEDSSQRQAQYLRVLGLMGGENSQESEQKVQGGGSLRQQFFTAMSIQIQKLNEEIRKLHELKNRKEVIMIEGTSVERMTEIKLRQRNVIEKSDNNGNEKHNIQGGESVELQKESGSMLVLQQNEKSLALSIQRSGQLKMIVQNLNRGSFNTKERQNQKKVLLSLVQEDNHDRSQICGVEEVKKGVQQQQVLQGQIQGQQQEQLVIIQQSQFQSQSITQEKSQQQFIRYMDNEYLQKKESEDNQANLSLNNISKIINIKPKQLHNKSIEIQHQMKQKQDDEVVAMLENQLRGNQQGKLRKRRELIDGHKTNRVNDNQNTYQNSKATNNKTNDNKISNIFLKQEQNLLQLKQEQQQQQQQTIQNQIILKDQQNSEIILMKQAPDNLNQCDYQNSLQPDQSQHQHNNKFFLALQAREKWIQSLQKDLNWKKNQLELIAKMKKILHNPYIEFQDY